MVNTMNVKPKIIVLTVFLFICCWTNAQPSVSEYKRCLEIQGEDPVEYIFRQFEKADVVILGERDHRDITQYELILRLLADKRFEEIGFVYTEVGCANWTESANRLIKSDWESEEEFQKALREHLRNEDYGFLWEKTNRSLLLDGLYRINRKIPKDKRISLGLTDIAFDWEKWTSPRKYGKWLRKNTYYHSGERFSIRDREMANNFLKQYKRQNTISGRRKALYIVNQPHAICSRNGKRAAWRIKKRLGENNVRIVFLNYYMPFSPGEYGFDSSAGIGLINGGLWDAAFYLTGNKPVAFDIKGTPFGKTKAWYWNDGATWENFVDGYIFYVPFYEFKGSIGIKDILTEDCRNEMQRRLNLLYDIGEEPSKDWDAMCLYYNRVRTFSIPSEKSRKRMLEQFCRILPSAQIR